MSDLIETWKNDFRAFVNSLNLDRDDYKTMMEYIDEIPAVQPEIIRCKDCKYMIDTGDDLMCDNAKGWVVATASDFGCVLAERRTDG